MITENKVTNFVVECKYTTAQAHTPTSGGNMGENADIFEQKTFVSLLTLYLSKIY